eukprot:10843355-Karenia_brevis.AAC.1
MRLSSEICMLETRTKPLRLQLVLWTRQVWTKSHTVVLKELMGQEGLPRLGLSTIPSSRRHG